jgi:ribonuclease BN (tRNA processing enzyme)
VTFSSTRGGRDFQLDGFHAHAVALAHPGGALGYVLRAEGESMAYLTDTCPFASPGEGVAAGEDPTPAERRVMKAIRGCQMVVYDTMYPLDQYLEKMTWGHSYPEYAHALCRAAGVAHLVLFHHAPDASDDELDALEEHWSSASEPSVSLAREGDTVSVQEVAMGAEG